MELFTDKRYEEQFHKLIKNFLAKNDNYKTDKFIGGLPVTLEKNDMFNLVIKDKNENYKYSVTQKVDGTRVLMYIGLDFSETKGVKQRAVSFIDRNMKTYTLRNDSRDILPYVNSGEILLDGEIVFFDKDGNSHKELESKFVKGISFMAFDILFGPEDIKVSTDGYKEIGQSVSMVVPLDGKLRTNPWYYINRYDILHKMIIPSQFNKNEPLLTEAFKNKNWFNIELKPIYFLDSLKPQRNLYDEKTKSGYLQRILTNERKSYYKNVLQDFYGKNINVFTKKSLNLDGLIFTSRDTLYTIGPWNKYLTTQYKWKPVSEQTLDFYIKKKNQGEAELFMMDKGNNLVPYQRNYKTVVIQLPHPDIKDNSIIEVQIVNQNDFVFKEIRKDKKLPNSLRTINNVMNSFKNPVFINDIYYFLNMHESEEYLKKVLEHSTKKSMIRCITQNRNIKIIDENDIDNINREIREIDNIKDLEIELRFGNITTQRFNPEISDVEYDKFIKKLSNSSLVLTIEDFVDVYSDDKVRTRHLYSDEFNKYMLSESIIKTRISNLDFKMKTLLDFDVRVSMSTENSVKMFNRDGKSYRKYRMSYFDEAEKMFRIDLTRIYEGSFRNREFIQESNNVKNQLEIEILSSKLDINNLLRYLVSLFGD